MGDDHTTYGMRVNRIRNAPAFSLYGMGDGMKKTLWANVRALMLERWGEENLNRLAREAKIGPGSAQRIKEGQTSVGLDVVEKVARALKVEPHLILFPMGQDRRFKTLLEAYSFADERGKELLDAAAETVLRKRDRPTEPERARRTGTSE